MFSLFVTLASVHARPESLGPCFLYDRFCLETIWKPRNEGGFAGTFGTDLLGNQWQTTPEKHKRHCFHVQQCKDSGIALLCKTPGQNRYEKTYVSNSLPGDTDYVAFYKHIDGIGAPTDDPTNICVTLKAEVGGLQALDEDIKTHSTFQAKYITDIQDIQASNECAGVATDQECKATGALLNTQKVCQKPDEQCLDKGNPGTACTQTQDCTCQKDMTYGQKQTATPPQACVAGSNRVVCVADTHCNNKPTATGTATAGGTAATDICIADASRLPNGAVAVGASNLCFARTGVEQCQTGAKCDEAKDMGSACVVVADCIAPTTLGSQNIVVDSSSTAPNYSFGSGFSVTLKCSLGFSGSPTATKCLTAGQEYVVAGTCVGVARGLECKAGTDALATQKACQGTDQCLDRTTLGTACTAKLACTCQEGAKASATTTASGAIIVAMLMYYAY